MAKRKASDTFLTDIAATTFQALQIDITKIDRSWERERGAMMRIALLVLRDDDKQLAEKFCQSDESAHTGLEIVEQLQQEVAFQKNVLEGLQAAISRLMTVAARRQIANDQAKAVAHG